MNILLLGGSNTLIRNGLADGLKSHGDNVLNFGLGNSGSLQNLYELINILSGFKDCNKAKGLEDISLQDIDLIVTESALNDVGKACFNALPMEEFLNVIELFYYCLYLTRKKVVVLFLPFGRQRKSYFEYNFNKEAKSMDSIFLAHKKSIARYGFNFIDMFDYYKTHNLFNVFSNDLAHENPLIMFKIGSLIAKSFDVFLPPKWLDSKLALDGLSNVLENIRILTPDYLKYVDNADSMSVWLGTKASFMSPPPPHNL